MNECFFDKKVRKVHLEDAATSHRPLPSRNTQEIEADRSQAADFHGEDPDSALTNIHFISFFTQQQPSWIFIKTQNQPKVPMNFYCKSFFF